MQVNKAIEVNKIQSWFFEKVSKTDKLLVDGSRKKGEYTNYQYQEWKKCHYWSVIKRIIRKYNEHFIPVSLRTYLNELNKLFEGHKLQPRETDNCILPNLLKKLNLFLKSSPKKNSRLRWFQSRILLNF